MLQAGRGFFQGLITLQHHALEAGQVALVHPGHGAAGRLLVADLLQFKDPTLGAVPHDHAQFILGAKRGEHALRAVPRDLIAIAELHAVHHEHDRTGRQHLLAVELHVHRERGFERRALVSPGHVGLIAAHANQTDAEVAHRAFELLHQAVAQIAGGDVAQKNGVVALQLGEGFGKLVHADDAHFEIRRAQGGGEVGVLRRIRRDEQDARITAHIHKRGGAVVLRQAVTRDLHLDRIGVELRIVERLRKGEEVLARLEFHLLLAEELFIAVKAQPALLLPVGLDEDLRLNRLPLLHPRGQAEALHGDIIAPRRAERDDVNGHAQWLRGENGVERIADVLVAVGEQDDPFLAGLRKRRRAEPDRARDVSPIRTDHGENLLLLGIDEIVDRGFQGGIAAKHEQPDAVVLLFIRRDALGVFESSLLLWGRHAVRAVEDEHDVHPFERLPPLQPGDGQDQRGDDDEAEGEGDPTARGANLHVGLPEQPRGPGQRREQREQVERVGELEVHGWKNSRLQTPNSNKIPNPKLQPRKMKVPRTDELAFEV